MDILVGIMRNVSFLFAYLFIIHILQISKVNQSLIRRIVLGFVLGFIAIGVMSSAFTLQEGVFYDTRSVIVSITALFFSLETALITAFVAIGYRIYLGGIGAVAGVLTILFSFIIGRIWRHLVTKRIHVNQYLEMYLFGIVVHIFMLIAQFAMPNSLGIDVIKDIWLPVLLIYPLAVMAVGVFIKQQISSSEFRKSKEISEEKYRRVFDENPLGMFQYDNKGIIQIANSRFAEILQTNPSNLIGLDMTTLPNKKLVDLLTRSLAGETTYFEDFYQSVFSGHRFYTRVQFMPFISDKTQIGGIGLVEDLTESYESKRQIEELIKTDPLTKTLNRQTFDQLLFQNHTKNEHPISILIGDINTFQIINETFGFDEGNRILIEISNIFKSKVSKNIRAFRTGGDEFSLIMFKTNENTTKAIMEELKDSISHIQINNINMMMSFGVATCGDCTDDLTDVYQKALTNLKSNKVLDGSSVSKKTIDIVMATLFEKNKRELSHSERVGEIAGKIAEEFHLGTAFNKKVKLAGRLHDIGKINLDQTILDKPGKLTDAEWQMIKKHPESGFHILSSVPEYLEIAGIVLSHHERFDGTGYPNCIKGHDIPLPSRIITLADSFDAMTVSRPYHKSMTLEESIEEIRRCSGTHFDPEVVEIFIKLVEENKI